MSFERAHMTTDKVTKKQTLYFLNPLYIILLSWIPLVLGFVSGIQFLLPLLITIPSYFVMRKWILQRQVMTAYYEMLLSCLWMSIAFILLSYYFPVQAENVIFRSTEYVADMDEWIRTGGATEGTPALFISEHLRHIGIIIVASLLTGGFVALFFGAMQMGYMNFYVAWLIINSGGDPFAYCLAWPIWSVVRVLSFVLLTVVLAQPLLLMLRWRDIDLKLLFKLAIVGIILEGIDIGLKTVIGPYYQTALNAAMEYGPAVGGFLINLGYMIP